jgi:hypothetical protein
VLRGKCQNLVWIAKSNGLLGFCGENGAKQQGKNMFHWLF